MMGVDNRCWSLLEADLARMALRCGGKQDEKPPGFEGEPGRLFLWSNNSKEVVLWQSQRRLMTCSKYAST
jgi:hypothetical protein